MARQRKSLPGEFKDFVLRGNVLDLAVAVVIGAAFGAVVSALVKDILTPMVAAVFGDPDFSAMTFSIHNSVFRYGDFLNAVIAFLSIAATVFFVVVKTINILHERRKRVLEPESSNRPCPECLSQIPKAASRCAYCTATVPPLVALPPP
jgi:large conductance mechanosensitive channel